MKEQRQTKVNKTEYKFGPVVDLNGEWKYFRITLL